MATPAPSPVYVVGPTASGKTQLAVALGEKFGGEIINADSRQVYRHMDIGTAKPTSGERAQVTHHLLDILDPDQDFGLGCFLPMARDSVEDCQRRDALPIVAGGTGQYVWALAEGWRVPQVPPDPQFRAGKLRIAEKCGPDILFAELQRLDPDRAAQLDYRNVRRVVRALEVIRSGGTAPQADVPRPGSATDSLIIGLTLERKELYRRIDLRVDRMMQAGFLEEVQGLARRGYTLGTGPLASHGYRELGQYLAGELSLDEAVQRTKYQTHRLARRQYTWFKPSDHRIHWLDASSPDLESRAFSLVEAALAGKPLC